MIQELQSYCPSCQRLVLARRTNNTPLALFLFCLPLALLIVLFGTLLGGPYRCPTCGTDTTFPDGTPAGRFDITARGCLTFVAVLMVPVLLLALLAIPSFREAQRINENARQELRQRSTKPTPASRGRRPTAKSPASKLTPEAALRLRLVRENDRSRDPERALALRDAIVAAGERCEAVSAAYMGTPGLWEVHCPAAQYQVEFDGSGKVVRVFKTIG